MAIFDILAMPAIQNNAFLSLPLINSHNGRGKTGEEICDTNKTLAI
jgi:hypothetical protein